MLHIMFFALIIGIAITLMPGAGFGTVRRVMESLVRDHVEDHRHHHEVRAVRGRVSDL